MILLALVIVMPVSTMAGVNIGVGISLPPPVTFAVPPNVIALPDTPDVYVDPDVNVDLYFWNGWWWRLWDGRWYRSHYYDRSWGYYNSTPSFYFDVDPGWRGYYRDHMWQGHRWNYERVTNQQLQQNWKGWHSSQHWAKQGNWGVQGYQPRPQQERQAVRNQRQTQYKQRPEVQREQLQREQKIRQPQQRQQQRQPQVRQPQRQQQRQPQVRQPRQQQGQPQVRQPQRQQQGQPQVRQPQGQQQRQPQVRQPQQKEEHGEEHGR